MDNDQNTTSSSPATAAPAMPQQLPAGVTEMPPQGPAQSAPAQTSAPAAPQNTSAPSTSSVAQPDPNAPHAGLRSILQSLFLGMDAFASSAATGGREGGVQEVQQVRAGEQKMQLEKQAAQREQNLADLQAKHLQAVTNATIAQTEINKMNAPLEHQKLVIGNQDALYNLYVNTLHINPLFAVPIVQGQTTDDHMAALNAKANGDLVNNTVIPVHDEGVGGNGNTYGFSFDQLRKVNVPIEQAAPVLANLQNQINLAKSVLPDGEKDPAIQAAQGKLDVLKKGATINGYDFFVFDNQVQANILQRVNGQQQIQDFQQKAAAARKAQQEADPLFKLENDPNEMAGEKSSAAIALLQNKVGDPATAPVDKVRATRLLAQARTAHSLFLQDQIQKANAEQAAKQGDPNSAGAMLANGDLTLTDMKTRGMTPKFIEDAVNAAKKVDPSYRPADEMAAEQVARSPEQNKFFGSANSLIEKGGTLDQLQANYDKLPNGRFPLFNKISDYTSYAAGHPEMAGFMQTAIGAADDYAKVMGGGQGSDSARLEILHSFANSHSPAQMKAAIDSARAAVGSQVNARIGTNKFMRRMYGGALPSAPARFDPSKLPDAK